MTRTSGLALRPGYRQREREAQTALAKARAAIRHDAAMFTLLFRRPTTGDLRTSRALEFQSAATFYLVKQEIFACDFTDRAYTTLFSALCDIFQIPSASIHGIRCNGCIHAAKERSSWLTYRSHYRTRSARALTRRHHRCGGGIHLQPQVARAQLLAHSITRWSKLFALLTAVSKSGATIRTPYAKGNRLCASLNRWNPIGGSLRPPGVQPCIHMLC